MKAFNFRAFLSKKSLVFLSSAILPITLSIIPVSAKTTVEITSTSTPTQSYGQVIMQDTPYGLLIMPTLEKLPVGLHGFHLHQHAACDHDAKAAGEHYDPHKTGKHLGPYDKGHLGDLPALYVNDSGIANLPILAPRLKESDLVGRAIIIHVGGDNYSDLPAPNGGGGERLGCGILNTPTAP